VARSSTTLAKIAGVVLDLATVQTNIVIFRLAPDAPDAATVVARARERGVLVSAFAARTVRLVTHLNVDRQQCEHAADVLGAVMMR
jgi:threonine aldolase